jgi:hypothetical protein
MSAFSEKNRDLPMWHTVATPSYMGVVPTYRALALMLDHAWQHKARFELLSADRRDSVLARFNKLHGTNLHGQKYLFDLRAQYVARYGAAGADARGVYAANPPNRTGHCLFSDGNPAYRVRGHVVPPGGGLPNYFLPFDATDQGKENDCTHLVLVLNKLGYHAVRPYPSGGEAHHFCLVSSPIPVLRHWNVIPKES